MDPALAGIVGGGLDKCFPPIPRAMMKVITTGIQAIFSYLNHACITVNWPAGKY
jgi:hypothetical protein